MRLWWIHKWSIVADAAVTSFHEGALLYLLSSLIILPSGHLVILCSTCTFLWQFYQNYGCRRSFLLNLPKLSLCRFMMLRNTNSVCTSWLGLVLQLRWHHSVITVMEGRIRLTLTQMATFDCGEGHWLFYRGRWHQYFIHVKVVVT